MKETALKIINDLKKYDELYIIGHNNIDFDSYYSSWTSLPSGTSINGGTILRQ